MDQLSHPDQGPPLRMVSSSLGLRCSVPGVWLTSYQLVCYKGKCKASLVRASSFRSHGLETGLVSASFRQPQRICLSSLHSALLGLVKSPSFLGSHCSFLLSEGVVHTDLSSLLVEEPLELPLLWNLLVQPHIWRFHHSLGTLRLHAWKLSSILSERLAFQERLRRWSLRISGSTGELYQRKWSRFLHWCRVRNLTLCKTTVQQIGEFFLYMRCDLKMRMRCNCAWYMLSDFVRKT